MYYDATDIVLTFLKIAIVLGVHLTAIPIMVWVERRGAGLIQDRPGPNRVGPWGLIQPVADVVKLVMKEDLIPAKAHAVLYSIAPTFLMIPALTTIAVIPWGRPFTIPEMSLFGFTLFEGGRYFEPIVANVDAGILVIFALSSLGVYGLATAGWSSNNKYSLLGGVRASAQMISYELSLTLAGVAALMAAGSLRLTDIVARQAGYFVLFDMIKIPAWNIIPMFIGFVVFYVSGFAETNRTPFDLPEADSELVAGYHTEYSSSMKFAMFYMGEYMAMGTISAFTVTLFLGGWDIPWWNEPANFLGFALSALAFLAKVAFLMFVFVWVRWTLPRFKYNQLMQLGWKAFLPLAVLNILIVGVLIAFRWI
ncbi:MAG: NADH-quinone oxidoreductase subunit NuoH [Thermoanaerobaculia bacterium]